MRWALLLLMLMAWRSIHSSQPLLLGLLPMMIFVNLGLLMGRNGLGQLLQDGIAGVYLVDVEENYAYPLQPNYITVFL